MKELSDICGLWEAKCGQPLALATLVTVRGSSYRRPGARMLISTDGSVVGSLSGGCLEEEVVAAAREVLRTEIPALLTFDTRRRFGCNGSIEIFVEKVQDEFLANLSASLKSRQRCRAVTVFQIDDDGRGSQILRADESVPEGAFIQTVEPPILLIIFGGGHDNAPLHKLAGLLGWSTLKVEQAADLPASADDRTAAIVKSHNYGRDCAALRHLLGLGLRYVGLMGPRARRDQLLGDLVDSGVLIERELFAPSGLDLGAEGPEEIALAVIAEIQSVFAGASGEPLRDRRTPIHAVNVVRAGPSSATEECETSAR